MVKSSLLFQSIDRFDIIKLSIFNFPNALKSCLLDNFGTIRLLPPKEFSHNRYRLHESWRDPKYFSQNNYK